MTRPKSQEDKDEEDEFGCGGVFLFIVSALAGLIFLINSGPNRIGLTEVLFAFAIMLLYPLAGALMVNICKLFRDFAFPHTVEAWSRFDRLVIAAIWPLSLLYWLIVGPGFAIINRVFR